MNKKDNETILKLAKTNLKSAIDTEMVADIKHWVTIYINSVYYKSQYKINNK